MWSKEKPSEPGFYWVLPGPQVIYRSHFDVVYEAGASRSIPEGHITHYYTKRLEEPPEPQEVKVPEALGNDVDPRSYDRVLITKLNEVIRYLRDKEGV